MTREADKPWDSSVRRLTSGSVGIVLHRGIVSLRTRGIRETAIRVGRWVKPTPSPLRVRVWTPPGPAGELRFAPPNQPTVTVIIPAYNHWEHTFRCLAALSASPPRFSVEILVVDDGSSDGTQSGCLAIPGLKYHRRDKNEGFIAACADGAAHAAGTYLVFLNNDTIPQPGWLDAMVGTFKRFPEAGLVGAQLLYPDGRLQEAGGVVFNNGQAANYGRLGSPDDPRFAFVRDCDYCSGAAIAVRRDDFIRMGGFDSRFMPAYYEDTDLAFSIREHGQRVLYQPAARVVHVEGVSSGTDVRSGVKAYQIRNQQLFFEKRSESLRSQPPPGLALDDATLGRGRPAVLVVDGAVPQPDRDSGSLRIFNVIRLLQRSGAHVVFRPFDNKHGGVATERLQQLGVETWYAPYGGDWARWLRKHGPRFNTVIVCRYHVVTALLPLLRKHAPQARLVFDTVDLHHVREMREAVHKQSPGAARRARRTRHHELSAVARTDLTLVVSEVERELLALAMPAADVLVLSNLHEVAGPGLPFAKRSDLVFVGGFQHAPNRDAVRWFVREIFPSIRVALPGVVIHCVGADPTPDIVDLETFPGVVVHGHVPDLTPFMDGMRVGLAPLRFGAGVKGKVNLSMAHGQPVVATSLAAEGMHVVPGRDLLVADTAEEFATAVVNLYTNEQLWNQVSQNGLGNVGRHFSFEAGRAVVESLVSHTQHD